MAGRQALTVFILSPNSDERQGAEAASLADIYRTSLELCVAILLLECQIIFYFVQENIIIIAACKRIIIAACKRVEKGVGQLS